VLPLELQRLAFRALARLGRRRGYRSAFPEYAPNTAAGTRSELRAPPADSGRVVAALPGGGLGPRQLDHERRARARLGADIEPSAHPLDELA
jgi:hypothetical protein